MDTVEDSAEAVNPPTRRERYAMVNAVGLPRVKLDDREALKAAWRLFKLGRRLVDKPWRHPRITLKVVYGNLRTYILRGRVNPCHGWWGLVHDVSHDIEGRHTAKHEWLERQLAEYVRDQGWLEGKLKTPEKPKRPMQEVRYERIVARLASWERKFKRAQNAIRKLRSQKLYYERRKG